MNRQPLVSALVLLSFLGTADAAYLAYSALTGSPLVCTIEGLSGCNVVAKSAYSHLFGIPLGVYGVVFYGVIFLLSLFLFAFPVRLAHRTLAMLGTIGLVASAIFLYIQVVLIKALCVYCLASALISLLTFIVTLWLWKRFTPSLEASLHSVTSSSDTPGL